MKSRIAGCLVTVATAVALIAPLFAAQAAKPDPKELAAIEKIRARIEAQAKKTAAAKPAAYKVTIPNTTVSYGMAPIPAGWRRRVAVIGSFRPTPATNTPFVMVSR